MPTDTVPQGTIQEILDWVGDDPARAQAALEAEREGQHRSTLIAQLELITEEDQPVSETTTDETTDETIEEPQPPREIELYAGDHGTTILPVHVRDEDVEVADDQHLSPDPEAERDDTLIAGNQVEFLTGAIAPNGVALSINGDVFLFNGQMVGSLKAIVDKAVVGLTL